MFSKNSGFALTASKRFYTFTLGLILILSLVLRLYGLRWGIPNEIHILSYHPDESIFFFVVSQMDVQNLNFNPHWFVYPTFYYYLMLILLSVLTKLGLLFFEPNLIFYGLHPIDIGNAHLIGRSFTALFGGLTVYLTYLTSRELYNEKIGILAALFLGIAPLHVIHSHFLTVDVPMTFWYLLVVYFSSKILKSGELQYYILAGISLGLGTSTKYNAGIGAIVVLVAHYLNNRRIVIDGKILKFILASIIFFVIGSPYSILAFKEFKWGLSVISVLSHAEKTAFYGVENGWMFFLKRSLFYGLGPMLLILTIIGVFYIAIKFTDSDILLLTALVPYYLIMGAFPFLYARYLLPLIPLFSIISAKFIMDFKLKGKLNHLIIITVLFLTLIYSLSFLQLFVMEDPRDQASDWITTNIPPGKTIGIPYETAFYTPPIDGDRYNLKVILDVHELNRVDYYVITDFDFNRFIKSPKTRAKYQDEALLYDNLFNSGEFYTVGKFENSFGIVQKESLPLDFPEDLIYPNPTVFILKKVD